MARKLSRIAWSGTWILATTCAMADAVDNALAQGGVRVSSPPTVVPNPFAARRAEPEMVAVEPATPPRGPVTYHNPFAKMSVAPPIDVPIRPGPVSRWRRPATLVEESPVKKAVLATDGVDHTSIPWDELPPAESLRRRAAASDADDGWSSVSSAVGTQGSGSKALDFVAQPLEQPDWFAPQRPFDDVPDAKRHATMRSVGQADLQEPAQRDPFEEANLAGPIIATGRDRPVADSSTLDNAWQSPLDLVNSQPLIISDYSDSPEGNLAQAQQRATSAKTAADLSVIADICQRGLASGPPPEIATPLRRLAAWAHNRRGEFLIDEGRDAEAVKDFQVAISLDPNCSLAIHNRAVTLAQQNETEAALRDFNRVIELNPGLAIAYRNRAELLASLGRLNEAVRDYGRAINGLPHDAALYCARGSAWHRLGDLQQSLADLNQSIRIQPNNPDAFTERGNLHAERGDFEQAINDLRQAIHLDPEWAEAYRSLAWLHATCPNPHYHDATQAVAAAKQAAELSPPEDCFVLDTLAAAYASGGQFSDAVRVQTQAVAAAAPGFADPLRQRLTLYQQQQPYLSGPELSVRAASHETEAR